MKYLIIGNGIAGVCAAEAIRELDSTGEIVMVGDETELPYSRPMITNLLEGSCTPDQLPIRSPDFYSRLNITPILGHRVKDLNVEQQTIAVEPDPEKAALFLRKHIETKRAGLGLDERSVKG